MWKISLLVSFGYMAWPWINLENLAGWTQIESTMIVDTAAVSSFVWIQGMRHVWWKTKKRLMKFWWRANLGSWTLSQQCQVLTFPHQKCSHVHPPRCCRLLSCRLLVLFQCSLLWCCCCCCCSFISADTERKKTLWVSLSRSDASMVLFSWQECVLANKRYHITTVIKTFSWKFLGTKCMQPGLIWSSKEQ